MTELTYLDAGLLGLIQALTEFLPISSSAHLAITQKIMGLDPDAPNMLLFDVAVHVGTVVAVLAVFRASVHKFLVRLVQESSRSWDRPRHAWRIAGLAICATIPTGVIGLVFKDELERTFDRQLWIAGGLVLTGVLLALTGRAPKGRKGWKRFGAPAAGLVGVVQGLAILPGVSRSGSTISCAMFLGLRRQWAAQFSFLIAIPAILGAALIKGRDIFNLPPESLASLQWGPILLGTLVSIVVGYGALRLLLFAVRRTWLHYFAPYCWAAAAVIAWRWG